MSLKLKPRRSLRTILTVWFLLFSIVPLAFVTIYSIKKYELAIDNELSQRISGNAREIAGIFSDFKNGIQLKKEKYLKDNFLIYHVSVNETQELRNLANQWLKSDFASALSFFNRDGRMLMSAYKDSNGDNKEIVPQENAPIYLSDQNLEKLSKVKEYSFVEFGQNRTISLIVFNKIFNKTGKHVGYLEQTIDIGEEFLNKLKNRLKLELGLMKSNGQPVVATNPDLYLNKKEVFQKYLDGDKQSFFEFTMRGVPYGFLIYPVSWGNTDFYLVLGASKVDAKNVLSNVNYAFFTVIAAVIFLLVVTIVLTSNTIIKPISELLEALQDMQSGDRMVEIPIKRDTEIGLLTESFNQMNRKVTEARLDLKKKIAELEKANSEIKDTQTRLVHSSKMVSLGQLVAGVAHELNNPIGFIYSNMAHLRDYSERLLKFADLAELNPAAVADLKKNFDIEFIREDMPKLIASCEDGARRTRDIVLGLRNFSRLEESKLKELDINESIDSTLNLLSGEIKNRIQILKNYGNLPLVNCYSSQINQVFMNILSNAVQAIEGTGNIWITTKVLERMGRPKMAQISVQDSGKGMSSEVMEKIFDPFFSTKGVGQGTGLGLSISYGIIQSHGGDIQVKSQTGIGTEFIITIPVKFQLESPQK